LIENLTLSRPKDKIILESILIFAGANIAIVLFLGNKKESQENQRNRQIVTRS
jgi:hypothetical protein